jgi:hypothetical protein
MYVKKKKQNSKVSEGMLRREIDKYIGNIPEIDIIKHNNNGSLGRV